MADELPAGWKWAEEPAAAPELPSGWKWAEDQPAAQPQGDYYQRHIEALKNAGVPEPAARFLGNMTVLNALTDAIVGTGQAIKGTAQTVRDVYEGKKTEITPAELMTMATTFSPASAGAAVRIPQRTLPGLAKDVLGADIPQGVFSPLGKHLSDIPTVGGPLQKSAQEALTSIEAAGARAPQMAAGKPVTLQEAGNAVRAGANREVVGQAERVAPEVAAISEKNAAETAFNDALGLAKKDGGNVQALASLKRGMTKDEWGIFTGHAIEQMGQTAAKDFDHTTFMKAYGELSPAGRKMLFGDNPELMRHLDTLYNVSRTYGGHLEALASTPSIFSALKNLTQPQQLGAAATVKALGGAKLAAAAAGAHVIGLPVLPALGVLMGAGRITAKMLSKPENAASIANWAKAYRGFQSVATVPAAATLARATKELANQLGIDPTQLNTDVFKNLPATKTIQGAIPQSVYEGLQNVQLPSNPLRITVGPYVPQVDPRFLPAP